MVLVRRARRVGTDRKSRACPERRYDAQVKFVVALVILSDALRSRVTRSPGLVLIGDRSSEGSQDAFEIMPNFRNRRGLSPAQGGAPVGVAGDRFPALMAPLLIANGVRYRRVQGGPVRMVVRIYSFKRNACRPSSLPLK